MGERLKSWALFATLPLLILALVELLAFVFFQAFAGRFTFHDATPAILAGDRIEAARSIFDPKLGWDVRYDTPEGERPRATAYPIDHVATFGDSYTHCDEVGDTETWQHYLSALIGANVYNFGTGGHGTDQAYLKYQQIFPELETPVVTLGLITENINRIVNVFRPFYFPHSGIQLVKPRFVLDGDALRLVENPIRSANDLSKLQDRDFVERLPGEYWFDRHEFPRRSFPFARILFHPHFHRELRHGRSDDIRPRGSINLWDDDETARLMLAILDHFARDARSRGATPIVMLLPAQDEIARQLDADKVPAQEILFRQAHPDGFLFFDGIRALAESVRDASEIESLYASPFGHISAHGNKLIAVHLHEFLRENDLLP